MNPQSPKWKFTEKQKLWIREYFRSAFNASKATRVVYGGTPISCRVKGWRRKRKFEAILADIFNKNLYMVRGGVDAYLYWLESGNRWALDLFEEYLRKTGPKNCYTWPYPIGKP